MENQEFVEEYTEIDLRELLARMLEKWWFLLLMTVIAGGIAFYITWQMITPVYTAQSTIFIGKDSTSVLDISMEDLNMDSKLATDYKELINTRMITERVIKELALTTEVAELSKFVEIDLVNASRFMHISFTDPNPDLAKKIVNKYSDVLKEKAEDVVGVKNVQIVDYAIRPLEPSGPNLMKNTAVAALLGLMLAIGIILLDMLLNNTFQREEEIERELGLPVLGRIPKFKGEPK